MLYNCQVFFHFLRNLYCFHEKTVSCFTDVRIQDIESLAQALQILLLYISLLSLEQLKHHRLALINFTSQTGKLLKLS